MWWRDCEFCGVPPELICDFAFEFAQPLLTDAHVGDIVMHNNVKNPCWYDGFDIPCTKFERPAVTIVEVINYHLSVNTRVNGTMVTVKAPCRVEECGKLNQPKVKRGFCNKCYNDHGAKYSAVHPRVLHPIWLWCYVVVSYPFVEYQLPLGKAASPID